MRKIQPAFALILLLAVQSLCVVPGLRGQTPAPGGVTEAPQDDGVGTINLVVSQVQTGPADNLQYLDGIQNFHNGDGVRVTEGGKGKLALNDGTQLTLFNETEVSGVNVSTSPPETDLFLQNQGFLGSVPPGGHTTVNMPNGAKITILGTRFFILHNNETKVATAGNFDGTVLYTPPSGTEQPLPPGLMVDIPPEGEVELLELPFTPEEFEQAVDSAGTPTAGLNRLRQEYKLTPLPRSGAQTITVTAPSPAVAGWSNWEDLGGKFKDAPTVASWAPDRLDIFARGTDDTLLHMYWAGSGWSDWEDLGGQITSSPAAVSWGENRIDIFALGTDHQVWQYVWDGQWSGWFPQGGGDVEADGQLQDAPAVSSWAPNYLDVFVRHSDNSVWHKYWDNSAWSDWEPFMCEIFSAPSVVSRDFDKIDIVARGADDELIWGNPIGSCGGLFGDTSIQDAPAITSWGLQRLDIFARSTDNNLLHTYWEGDTWSDLENLGGPIYSSPAAVSWSPGRIDVFAAGEAGQLMHISFQE